MATRTLLLASIVLMAAQDDDNAKARLLIQNLRSESIEEREMARKGLIEMGKAAAPALEVAARDADGEVAKVASVLLRRLKFVEILTPRMKRLFPGLENRLATGGDRECTVFFFEATQFAGRRNLQPLTRFDLDPLASPALRGVTSDEEFTLACETLRWHLLRGAGPDLRAALKSDGERAGAAAYTLHSLGLRVPFDEIAPLLKSKVDGVQWAGVLLLEALGGAEAVRALKSVAADTDSAVRSHAAFALHRLGDNGPLLAIIKGPPGDNLRDALDYLKTTQVRESIPALVELIRDEGTRPHWNSALLVLAGLRAAEAIPRAVELLADEDINLREFAVLVLRDAGSPREAGHLKALLANPSVSIQRAAIQAAAAWKARDLIPDLRTLLRNEHSEVRQAAVEGLGTLRAKEAVPEIMALVKDPEHSVREQAVWVLASLDAREAAPMLAGIANCDRIVNEVQEALQELDARNQVDGQGEKTFTSGLKSPDASVRLSVLRLLQYSNWQELAPEVARHLKDDDSKVRMQAIWTLNTMNATSCFKQIEELLAVEGDMTNPAFATLCRFDPKRAAPHMRRFLRHENRGLRHPAIFGLAKLGDPEGLAALEALAEDPGASAGNISEVVLQLPTDVRTRIARKLLANYPKWQYLAVGLATLADAEVQDRFAGFLEDPEPEVRLSAVSHVLSMGRKEDVARVRKLIEDPFPKVRAEAIRELGNQRIVEASGEIRERLFDIDPTVRHAAIWAVRSLHLTEAAPELEELLFADQNWGLDAAVNTLADFRSASSISRIKTLLSSAEPKRRSTALHALGTIGNREAVADVAARLRDRDSSVRSAAVASLALLKAVDYAVQIQDLLRDPEAGIRGEAVEALPALMGPRAIPHLIPLLEDPSIGVRNSAARNLVRIGSPAGIPRLLRTADYVPWYPLYLLNGVRQPDLYSRLGDLKLKGPMRGSVQQLLETLLKASGLALDDAAVRGDVWSKFLECPRDFDSYSGFAGVRYELQQLLSHPYDFVLEPDRLRVLTTDHARKFWKDWWADQQKKK